MVDFANLLAEYLVRVALWPGLALSLPLALALLWLRRRLPLPAPPRSVGEVGAYLISMATALILLATLPLAGLSVNLPGFGPLPNGQQLADALFAVLLLPLAAAALFEQRTQMLRWLVAYLPAAGGLLAVLSGRDNWLVRTLAGLAYIALLLTADALMSAAEGRRATLWLRNLAQQISWLALVALPLTILLPLTDNALWAALIYAASATGSAICARLLNRRWPELARRWLQPAAIAALLAALLTVFAN